MGRLDASWVVSVGSVEVNSMMKSAKTCHLIDVLDLYLMSNSLSSMAHFTSLLEVSVYVVFASLGVMSESRWCGLRSMVEAFWQWSPMPELDFPSSDTFLLLPSELDCSNRSAATLYPVL